MAVKIKNLKSVFNSVRSIFTDSFERTAMLQKQADFLTNRIKTETRSGKDLTREGARQPALSEGYMRWRRKLRDGKSKSKIVPDANYFRPRTSNLTLTGQLLESVRSKVETRNRLFKIFVEGKRDDGLSNNEVMTDLKKRGRTFLGVDKKGVKRVRKAVVDELRRQIRQKRFTKTK
jgi:hypothetical protein